MATEPAEFGKTPAEIYSLESRSEQVIEAAKLLEYGLREYSGDYRSGFTQLYNANRNVFEKELRDKIRNAFEVRGQARNVAKHGDPGFESKSQAAETFVQAAQVLFKNYPQIFPERFQVSNETSIQDSAFFEQGFESHPEPDSAQPSAFENVRKTNGNGAVAAFASTQKLEKSEPDPDGTLPVAESIHDDEYVIPTYELPSAATLFEAKLSLKQLEKMCHRLGRSLKAGISITKAIKTESNNLNSKFEEPFEQVLREVSGGGTLANTVAQHNCFPPMFCEMVRVGEETGTLDRVFLRLADHYRNLIQMRRTFISGITWPIFQFCAAIGVISFFFIALSILESMLDQPRGRVR